MLWCRPIRSTRRSISSKKFCRTQTMPIFATLVLSFWNFGIANFGIAISKLQISKFWNFYAEVAQLVERNLAKVEVAGSSLVFRSEGVMISRLFLSRIFTLVVELVDTQDLKSCGQQCSCGFNSRPGYDISKSRCCNYFLMKCCDILIFFLTRCKPGINQLVF